MDATTPLTNIGGLKQPITIEFRLQLMGDDPSYSVHQPCKVRCLRELMDSKVDNGVASGDIAYPSQSLASPWLYVILHSLDMHSRQVGDGLSSLSLQSHTYRFCCPLQSARHAIESGALDGQRQFLYVSVHSK